MTRNYDKSNPRKLIVPQKIEEWYAPATACHRFLTYGCSAEECKFCHEENFHVVNLEDLIKLIRKLSPSTFTGKGKASKRAAYADYICELTRADNLTVDTIPKDHPIRKQFFSETPK